MNGATAASAPVSLAAQAYQTIEEMIVTLELPPGSGFSEAELSRRIGIGRTPLREALQRLATERLVTTLPRRGMIVTEINIGELLMLLETRRVLDRLIASRAATRALPAHREALRDGAARMHAAADNGDISAFMRCDREFDEILGAAARNRWAAEAVAPLHAHCRRFWYVHQNHGDLGRAAALHETLMTAVAGGDESGAGLAALRLLDYLEGLTRAVLDG